MDDAPLNKAHQEYRFAEKHLRYRRFDEAVHCHKKAAKYLAEALQIVTSDKALESIQCQYEFHVKQQDIVRMKKVEFENYKKAIESQRLKMANMLLSNDAEGNKQHVETIQLAIYKTMNEADSLLGMLINKDEIDGALNNRVVEDNCDECDSKVDIAPSTTPIGSKKPKDDRIVIEELRTLNQQLHSLVAQLLTQLEASSKEADFLRERVKCLEEERAKIVLHTPSTDNANKVGQQNLQVVTDSSGGTSPFVISPGSEHNPDLQPDSQLESPESLSMPRPS